MLALFIATAVLCHAQPPPRTIIPDFPDEFIATIEANFPGRNYTYEQREVWDYAGNQVRFDSYSSNGEITTRINFFNLSKQLDIMHGSAPRSCNVSDINMTREQMISGGHMMHARTIYEILPRENFTFLGREAIRGVDCNHWQGVTSMPSTFNRNYSSYDFTIHWYWSVPAWGTSRQTAGGNNTPKPVRVWVVGDMKCNLTVAPDCIDTAFNNYYEFTAWSVGPPDAGYFSIRDDYKCPNYLPPNSTGFPALAQDFIMNLEIQDKVAMTSTRRREYYDYTGNRIRLVEETETGERRVTVALGNEKMVYTTTFNPETKSQTCLSNDISSWTDFDEYMVAFPDGHLASSKNLLFNLTSSSWAGVRPARGYQCDVWVGERYEADENSTTSYFKQSIFFAVAGWQTTPDNMEPQAPIMVTLDGIDGDANPSPIISQEWHIVDYEADRPNADLFAINSGCVTNFGPIVPSSPAKEMSMGLVGLMAGGVLIVGVILGYCFGRCSKPALASRGAFLNSDD